MKHILLVSFLLEENQDVTAEEFESHSLKREKVIAGKSKASICIGSRPPTPPSLAKCRTVFARC
jgi:hypothetical protein